MFFLKQRLLPCVVTFSVTAQLKLIENHCGAGFLVIDINLFSKLKLQLCQRSPLFRYNRNNFNDKLIKLNDSGLLKIRYWWSNRPENSKSRNKFNIKKPINEIKGLFLKQFAILWLTLKRLRSTVRLTNQAGKHGLKKSRLKLDFQIDLKPSFYKTRVLQNSRDSKTFRIKPCSVH